MLSRLLFITIFTISCLSAELFFVSTSGSNTNSGSESSPYQTIYPVDNRYVRLDSRASAARVQQVQFTRPETSIVLDYS